MIANDEDALICDLAETYHIYDYRSLPVEMVATFSCGLREDSRIKLKMSGIRFDLRTQVLISIFDKLNWIGWTKTKDATKGKGAPESLLAQLLEEKKEADYETFVDGESFMKEWNKYIGE